MNRVHLTARGERVVASLMALAVFAVFIGAHGLVALVCGPEVI